MQHLRKFEDFPSTSTVALEEGCGIKKEELDVGDTREEEEEEAGESSSGEKGSEPAHHARRPMNAFLIFCKRHRGVVRERYPQLENRQITKILGEWWANLEPNEKASYTELAKQYKEAFLRANPDFKWYKLPAPPLRTLMTRPSNQKPLKLDCQVSCGIITPGKLADETQMGGLSSLLSSPPTTPTSPHIPKPPKKRYLEAALANQACGGDSPDFEAASDNVQKFTEIPQKVPVSIASPSKDTATTSPSNDEVQQGDNNKLPSSTFASPFTKLRSHASKLGQTKGKQTGSDEPIQPSNIPHTAARGVETTIKTSQQQVIDCVVDRLYSGARVKGGSTDSWNLVSDYEDSGGDPYVGDGMGEPQVEGTNLNALSNQVSDYRQLHSSSQIDPAPLESAPCDSYNCDRMSEADSAISSRDDLNSSFGESASVSRVMRIADEEEGGSEERCNAGCSVDDATSVVNCRVGSMSQGALRKVVREQGSGGRGPQHNQPSPSSWSTPQGETRRKSLRACKGKRYQEFMNEGRIARGKRTRRPMSGSDCFGYPMPVKERRDSESSSSASEKTDSAFSEGSRGSREPDDHNSTLPAMGMMDLPAESQSLVDEKQIKEEFIEMEDEAPQNSLYGSNDTARESDTKCRKHSETSEESLSDSSPKKRFKAAFLYRDFNLDEKIEALPSLSLEEFQLKKRAKKKRNIQCVKRSSGTKVKKEDHQIDLATSMEQNIDNGAEGDFQLMNYGSEGSNSSTPLVGSQKRKARKQCITRLDPSSNAGRDTAVVAQEVLNNIGLATLAEVAAAKMRLTK
ncbi:HMG box transcription factor BBX isoform X2 [Ischnura elegans]|uniref:HMG box transcription factor BBX isoform X2 n=1 Tax=Ischnura elegans TaxID=197161 RepID=UPI001ED87972|nr:HMG box transcription factor BBX isoform X2 [Ischnura elegans]